MNTNLSKYYSNLLAAPVEDIVVADINECEDPDMNDCSPNARCVNTEGAYQCICNSGQYLCTLYIELCTCDGKCVDIW